jgi:hypothetical protein
LCGPDPEDAGTLEPGNASGPILVPGDGLEPGDGVPAIEE